MKGYLFDLDGTLIDSMDLHYQCWTEVLSTLGLRISKKEFMEKEGTNIYQLMRDITKIQDDALVVELVKRKDEIFREKYKFTPSPGVSIFLDCCLSHNIVTGIVTASSKDRLLRTLPDEFRDRFSVFVTSDDGGAGKPSPYPYRLGANKLGLHAEEIVVFENAPLGVQSAKAANMVCVGIGSTLSEQSLGDIDYFYDDFISLLNEWRFE